MTADRRWPWLKFVLPGVPGLAAERGVGCGCGHCRPRLWVEVDQDLLKLPVGQITAVGGVSVSVVFARAWPWEVWLVQKPRGE